MKAEPRIIVSLFKFFGENFKYYHPDAWCDMSELQRPFTGRPGRRITRAKIHRYMVLKVVDWGGKVKFKDLERWCRIEPKYIVKALSSLISWDCLYKEIGEDGYTVYSLAPTGKRLLKVYEERHGLKEYWTPPWK